ncbi:hypothetical protein R1flu_004710 [Riccia fluitans]|uniref:Uncharacterized protein n=1 Tax=Riccia fluitans TaxID=41844 RepID=A0ABD1YRL6_9MARC
MVQNRSADAGRTFLFYFSRNHMPSMDEACREVTDGMTEPERAGWESFRRLDYTRCVGYPPLTRQQSWLSQ